MAKIKDMELIQQPIAHLICHVKKDLEKKMTNVDSQMIKVKVIIDADMVKQIEKMKKMTDEAKEHEIKIRQIQQRSNALRQAGQRPEAAEGGREGEQLQELIKEIVEQIHQQAQEQAQGNQVDINLTKPEVKRLINYKIKELLQPSLKCLIKQQIKQLAQKLIQEEVHKQKKQLQIQQQINELQLHVDENKLTEIIQITLKKLKVQQIIELQLQQITTTIRWMEIPEIIKPLIVQLIPPIKEHIIEPKVKKQIRQIQPNKSVEKKVKEVVKRIVSLKQRTKKNKNYEYIEMLQKAEYLEDRAQQIQYRIQKLQQIRERAQRIQSQALQVKKQAGPLQQQLEQIQRGAIQSVEQQLLQIIQARGIQQAKKIQQQIKEIQCEAKEVEQQAQQIEWDEYYMKIACLAALRSKDPSTPVS